MTVSRMNRSYIVRHPFLGLLVGWIASQSFACADLNPAPTESPGNAPDGLRAASASPSSGVNDDRATDLAARIQMFAGSVLTTTRAAALAEANGNELIRFYPCPEGSDACAMFEVAGKHGKNTYLYQLSSEHCYTAGVGTIHTNTSAGATLPSTAPRDTSVARRSVSSRHAISSTQSTGVNAIIVDGTAAGAHTASNAASYDCFGGYRVNFRAKLENSLYVEPGIGMVGTSYEYQLYDAGEWKPVATINQLANSWYEGCTEWSSKHVEILDATGVAVVDETEVAPGGCAQSEPYTGDPEKDCKRVADATNGLLSDLSGWMDSLCEVSTLLTFIPDEVSVGYEQDGLTLGGTMNVDLCENIKAGREDIAGMVENAMVLSGNETPWMDVYNSCLADPGWFMPSEYGVSVNPPPVIQDGLDEIFASAPQEGMPTACSDYTTHVVQDMSGGTVCEADVRFACNLLTDGSCECKAKEVVGDMVCTSTP